MPNFGVVDTSKARFDFSERAAVNIPSASLRASSEIRLRPVLPVPKTLKIRSNRVFCALLQYQSLKIDKDTPMYCSDIRAQCSADL